MDSMQLNPYHGPSLSYHSYYDIEVSSHIFSEKPKYFCYSPQNFFPEEVWKRKTREQQYEAFMYKARIKIKERIYNSLNFKL